MKPFIRYVLTVVIDPVYGRTVGLTKLKGPSELLKKLTFPGGKIEGAESICDAASREMAQETGVEVDPKDWTLFETVTGEHFELNKLVAISDKVSLARQLEEEPVWVLDYAHHAQYAQQQPNQYVHDFLTTLRSALAAKSIPLSPPSQVPRVLL